MKGPELLRAAEAQGLIEPGQAWPDGRPWPVLLMTALGAWLAAIPLLGAAGALFGAVFERSAGLYGVGAAALALAVWLLKDRGQPLFVEQLGLPTLLAGLLCIGIRLTKDLPDRGAALAMALLCLGLAWMFRRAWLRMLLGAAATGLLLVVLQWHGFGKQALWPVALLLLGGVAALWWTPWPAGRVAAWADALGCGALCVLLVALALDAGVSWMLAGFGPQHWNWTSMWRGGTALAVLPLALAAAGLLAKAWPALRSPRWAACAALLAVASLALPGLAVLALAAALCALQQRWRLAGAAGLAMLWVLGSFYYRMDWTLQGKAIGLIALAGLLAAVARWPGRAATQPVAGPGRGLQIGLALAALAGLLMVNMGIAQKERLIASGEPLFVELAPVDPRSLMQGDFMRLNYDILSRSGEPAPRPGAQRPLLVLERDALGVGRFVRRFEDGATLAPNERLLELSPKDGRWTVVSDAWFFKEGEGMRWQGARYAELRVLPDGRALLVGLRGPELQPL